MRKYSYVWPFLKNYYISVVGLALFFIINMWKSTQVRATAEMSIQWGEHCAGFSYALGHQR